MKQPQSMHLSGLSLVERIAYRCGDWCNRYLKGPLTWWNYTMMNILIWLGISRRLHIHGLEHLKDFNQGSHLILVCNHRTFFDFFVVSWVTFNKTPLPRRVFFPVRSTFFYSSWIGIPFSFFMGGYAMFPPIFREEEKRGFNQYSLQRIRSELNASGCMVGFHPEGKRNKDPNPYTFLPPKKGVGEIIYTTPTAHVVPIYIQGLKNQMLGEIILNWFKPKSNPIHIHFGPTREYDAFRNQEQNADTYQQISNACMEEIKKLANVHPQSNEEVPHHSQSE